MAQKTRYKRKKKKIIIHSHKLISTMCAAIAIVLAVVLKTFNAHDPSWFYYSSEKLVIKNALGAFGAQLGAALFYGLGAACYLLIPIFFGFAWIAWFQKPIKRHIDQFAAAGFGIIAITALLYIYRVGSIGYMVPGGVVGQTVYQWIVFYFDPVVTAIYFWFVLFVSLVVISRMSFLTIFEAFFKVIHYVFTNWRIWVMPIVRFFIVIARGIFVPLVWLSKKIKQFIEGSNTRKEPVFEYHQEVHSFESHESIAHEKEPRKKEIPKKVTLPKGRSGKSYTLPQATLFESSVKEFTDVYYDQNRQLASTLEEKLLRFGIAGTVTKIKPGPVITLFEYQPDIDAKISKIQGLENDLALALEAMSVRVIAPIPGTALVGFEVANKERRPVFMRDIVRSATFQKTSAVLPIVLGKDTSGDNVVVDLADMPHLLVAGSTGSGKSVALNTLLVSLICKLSPDELKLIIIDPKRLEFSAYQDIPHLLFPIITQPHRAAPVLRWLVKVMEDRYEMMAQMGARSISDYKKICAKKGEPDELPYIVLMIDELADLMIVARKDIEESITRLAQMARAAGIHLIVATQRPSVDVLTGVIKVNFPSRMSFRVTSKIDSRTVLDALGAETLLGKGDMLFMDAHSARMRRIHGAYVADAEIDRVVEHVKAQQAVEYTSLEDAVAEYNQTLRQEDEPLLPQVIGYLETIDEISISSLQRRFKIGYNRSARIIELLEAQGKIMPSSGGKTRKVIH